MKIHLDSVGCRLNQSEIEKIAAQFLKAGWELAQNPAEADLAIVNTCTVTAKAAADSRQMIRKINRQGNPEIIVTGCWSTMQPEDAAQLPGVRQVISNLEKENVVLSVLNLPPSWEHEFSYKREPLKGNRKRTRAFIKVQDGCDQHCTYCVTRLARGKSRSRTIKNIMLDVNAAVMGGSKEIVLTGVQLGSWGKDFPEPGTIKQLILSILKDSDIPRIHLSSVEPWDIDEELIRVWENSRLCRHLHIPLQSGSESVLKRMARKMKPDSYYQLVGMIQSHVPEMAITTDVIAGFPGESDTEFNESCDFINMVNFSGGHVFSFSARPGTPAALMNDQIPSRIIHRRVNQLRRLFKESAAAYRNKFIGQRLQVLWEKSQRVDGGKYSMEGLSDNYVKVVCTCDMNLYNQISSVKACGFRGDYLTGCIDSFQVDPPAL